MSNPDCVQVAVRIRPLVRSETQKGCQAIVEQLPPTEPQIVIAGGKNDVYTFNHVFSPDVSQDVVYDKAVQHILDKLFEGYNVTILAYGQTGSGKTFTMGTTFNGTSNENMGVIPRAMVDIFDKIAEMDDWEFEISCSFMELYQESLYDLLSEKSREEKVVDIREDSNGIIIPGLTEIRVTNADDTIECLIRGSSGRAVGATAMNAESSRSHAIFTVNVKKFKSGDAKSGTSAKFHLVDLAGSERSKKTQATGDRFKEGVKINQGLLALGNVISALGSAQGSSGFISYRDSKLTRLLQDSLGGNSVTLMIACISPADYNCDETISTLRYADRARKIKNKPIVNQDPQQAEIRRLNQIIQELRCELLPFKGGTETKQAKAVKQTSISRSSSELTINNSKNIEKLNKDALEKNRGLQLQLQAAIHDVAINEMRAVIAEKVIEEFLETQALRALNCDACEKCAKILSAYKEEFNVISSPTHRSVSESRESIQSEDIQHKSEKHTEKQINFNNELQQLNRELALKEELHRKILGNLTIGASYPTDESTNDRLEEYENVIKLLENQISELNEQVHSTKAVDKKSKLAEERRKKVQQLEGELQEARKKSLQQAKLLKLKEKDSQRISNLSNEIQSMKAAKVKLLKTMRSESDNFRQWKLNREKEICQLKAKDQKRKNEMVRMESLHNKQQNVLKRKVEEAVAINKRLKEALDKHKSVQEKRGKSGFGHKNNADITSWIDHEIEVIMSVIDASITLQQLMEDRAMINSSLIQMEADPDSDPDEVKQQKQDLELRNAQIADLQQKIVATDIGSKTNTICDGLPTMPETKTALRRVLSIISENRKEFAINKLKLDDQIATIDCLKDTIDTLKNDLKTVDNKYIDEKHKIEKMYEEKLSVILISRNKSHVKMEFNDANIQNESVDKVLQETLDRMECLRDEVESYKETCRLLKEELDKRQLRRTKKARMSTKEHVADDYEDDMFDGFESEEAEEEEEDMLNDSSRDPTYRATPISRRKKGSSSLRETTMIKSVQNVSAAEVSKVETHCSCKSNCANKRCACRRSSEFCGPNCKCPDSCINKKSEGDGQDDDDEKENSSTKVSSPIIKVEVKQEDDDMGEFVEPTPKKSKIYDTEIQKLKYVFGDKKRKPAFLPSN